MTGWTGFTVLSPVCIECGAQLEPWTGEPGVTDHRDDRELDLANNALALQAHRHAAHRVEPAVGDLVTYAMPWRGHVLVSEVYRVDSIRPDYDHAAFAREMRGDDLAPLIGTAYGLVNPRRSDDRCFPFIGDPNRPLTFELVVAAPPVQGDLLDMLGWATDDEEAA